jgi:hypothetical protein
VLGLVATSQPSAQVRSYPCGSGTVLHIYAAPGHAGKATGTVARWDVDDLDGLMATLTVDGLSFEHYGSPVQTDTAGVHDSGYGRIAWFKDPDGNTFALEGAAT